jgi:VWFA-related protein
MRRRFASSAAFICVSWIGLGQDQSLRDNPAATGEAVVRKTKQIRAAASLRFDVNRVLIPATVTDPDDHQVQGLHKENFRLLQDGVPQVITEFFVDEGPVSVGIVLDASNSMRPRIAQAGEAIKSFLRLSLPEDEFFLISVQDHPELVHGFTTQADAIVGEVGAIQPHGWTALYDGMYFGISHLKRAARGRHVLLVLSDGGDNNSRYTESEIKALVRESDVRIFTISILDRSPFLERVAEESGGRALRVHKLDELPEKAAELSALVHGEYVLGFTPGAQNRDGKLHAVKVEVTQPADGTRLRVSWRRGYYAPLE